MRRVRAVVGVCAFSLAALPALAETLTVPFWTPVPVRFTRAITSREALLGQSVEAEIADDVAIDGHLVFRRGMPVWADVSNVKKKGGFGVPGLVEVKVVFAPAGAESVRIAGRVGSKGSKGGAGVAAAGIAFGLVGAWVVTGKSGEIPAGTTIVAHVDEEKVLNAPLMKVAASATSYQVGSRQ